MTVLTAPVQEDSVEEPIEELRRSPKWIEEQQDEWGERLSVPEWEDHDHNAYRPKNGWKGRDLVHDAQSPVRIAEYFVSFGTGGEVDSGNSRGGVGTRLTGIVVFTERAESHRGFCHGGSMCSVMDDVVGWCGFCVTGECRPWSGFTVQINTSLTKPVMVNSTLLVVAVVTKVERRKVFIEAKLYDPQDDSVHAECEGLVILNKGILQSC
jgi:acyl-coenzyme A thioesterase PaaI-like protein